SSFIAREQIMAKQGEHNSHASLGMSSLWLETMEEKIDRFGVFNDLRLIKNNAMDSDPILTFQRSESTTHLANFRIGDIAVIYPQETNPRNILNHQIFKCTLLDIGDETISIRLRNPQHNQKI